MTWFPPGAAGPASSAFPGAPQAPRVCSSSASPCVVGTGDRLHAPLAPQAGPQTVQSAPTLVIRHTPPPACLPHLLVGPESCTRTPARPRPGPYQWCPARLSQEPPGWSPDASFPPPTSASVYQLKCPSAHHLVFSARSCGALHDLACHLSDLSSPRLPLAHSASAPGAPFCSGSAPGTRRPPSVR